MYIRLFTNRNEERSNRVKSGRFGSDRVESDRIGSIRINSDHVREIAFYRNLNIRIPKRSFLNTQI